MATNLPRPSDATTAELLAALAVLAPDYVEAIRQRDSWKAKAAQNEHPGKGFCLSMADRWAVTAENHLEGAKTKLLRR
jgi:hypothetical protein